MEYSINHSIIGPSDSTQVTLDTDPSIIIVSSNSTPQHNYQLQTNNSRNLTTMSEYKRHGIAGLCQATKSGKLEEFLEPLPECQFNDFYCTKSQGH